MKYIANNLVLVILMAATFNLKAQDSVQTDSLKTNNTEKLFKF